VNLDGAVRRRRGEELEEALLQAAWDQLLDGGYGAFTIEAVAERAKTSRPVIYRRWPDRAALALAALAFGANRDVVEVPDTGAVRTDLAELLRRANVARAPLIPLLNLQLAAYYSETGTTFADLRREVFRERQTSSVDTIIERGIARGEIDPARVTPRIRSLPFDLFRHEVLMTLQPVPDPVIEEIVDDIFLPLVRPTPA
jgi:AcrR family transcriptional regulator